MCVREGESERGRQTDRETARESERQREGERENPCCGHEVGWSKYPSKKVFGPM